MSNIQLVDQIYLGLSVPAVLLCIPPLIVQARARNFAVLVLISSVLILNLQNFTNAIIWPSWRKNDWNGEILCDIEVRTYAALPVASTGAVACVFRQLAGAFRTDRVGALPTTRQTILKWTFELTLCVVFPVIVASTFHLPPYMRYSVTRTLGCLQWTIIGWRAIVSQLIWQPITTLIGAFYCVVTVYRLIRHRRNVSAILASSGLTTNRHTRLLVVSICGLLLGVPGFTYLLAQLLSQDLDSYQISDGQAAAAESVGRPISRENVSMDRIAPRWAQMAMAIPIFVALGLGREAYRTYAGLVPSAVKEWMTPRLRVRSFGQWF